MNQKYFRTAVGVLATVALVGCKDANLGPTGNGELHGTILDAETDLPVAGAGITTTPPSDAIVTDSTGRFAIEELNAGNYQITARKAGYRQSTATVAVRANRATTATVFLQREEPGPRASLTVEVLNFWNTVHADSAIAEAEYRVSNTGNVTVNAYDVNFRVTTTEGDRFQQERGQTLRAGQSDIRRFRLRLATPAARATAVRVESIWSDPPLQTD